MARQPEPDVVKIELRLDTKDPEIRELVAELRTEAAAAKSSLPNHVELLLLHRYRARRGQPFLDALWIPGGQAPGLHELLKLLAAHGVGAPSAPIISDDEPAADATARKVVSGFLRRK